MKTSLFTLVLWVLACSAFAETKSELDNKVRQLIARLETLQAQSGGAIPADKLQKAVGIIIMDRTKGGFVFGYEKGFGIAMVKGKGGQWSPFSFMTSHEGSFGAQVGGKNTFAVVLLMSDSAKDRLIQSKVDFGGEATGTGGDASAAAGDTFTDATPMLVYGTSSGLYGGATLKGGSLAADDKLNQIYYGKFYSSKDILFEGKVKPSETAMTLAKKLAAFSKAKK